ncbi:hypothetical protein L7F22_010387 [Adiantum nelumboides]|nr:hypothetical protein [Adiantum nelumboides]
MDSEHHIIASKPVSSPPPSPSSPSSSSHSVFQIAPPKVPTEAAYSPRILSFTASPTSSAFSTSPLINPSLSSRTVRFADKCARAVTPPGVATPLSSHRGSPFYASPLASTPPPLSPPTTPRSAHNVSPVSSAFVSASGSPFISPPVPCSLGSTPVALKSPPAEQEDEIQPYENNTYIYAGTKQSNLHDPSRYAVHQSSSVGSTRSSAHVTQKPKQGLSRELEKQPASLVSSAGSSAPFQTPRPLLPGAATSASPSSSGRPRSCDVYIGLHGQSSSLSRFSKWLRAELELQGIACFAADRARFSDARSHDIAQRIISSCTFGVVIITKKTFRNLYSIEELRVFLRRKNLVPLFFDLAPSDCLSRDIVERRGEVWEKDGGELWRIFDGEEREWIEALDGLARIEEWKLGAYNGNWRNCILKAVSLLGTRLGRRSVAERERVRKERVEGEEFPFPRNSNFVGRERELKALETMLFTCNEDPEAERDAEIERLREQSRSSIRSVDRWPKSSRHSGSFRHSNRDGVVSRRRSDADRWQHRFNDGVFEGFTARRRSDADRWRGSRNGEDQFLSKLDAGGSSSGQKKKKDKDVLHAMGASGAEIEVSRGRSVQRSRSGHRNRHFERTARHRQSRSLREIQSADMDPPVFEGGIACVSGASGIGKTEMVLEYAHRFSQWYRMVLWVGGEARYLRQNYLNLSLFLGLDVGTESQVGPEQGRIRTFDEQEMEAYQRVKRELQRDVPYLLIIDNLESERDWWDGREISELIPRAGGATHVIFTTRLPKVMNLGSLDLSYLSGVEALSLMKGKREFSSQELDALKEIEEKLGRLPYGLGIVGTLLSELPIMPSELLEKIEKSLMREWTWQPREETTLKNNPYLVKLLGVCLSFLDQTEGPKDLSKRMALVAGWFSPFPIPLSLLALAASKYPEGSGSFKALKSICGAAFCCCASSQTKRWEAEAGILLMKYGLARGCTRQGWVIFHEIVQLYSRKRGGNQAAKAMVQGVRKRGAISLHSEHFWSACFLVFGFGNDPVTVELKVVELLSFIRRGVLQLAIRSFTSFSRCYAAQELLRLCTSALENVEKSFVSQVQDWWERSFCWKRSKYAGQQVDEFVWQDVTLLKALLLETRAKLMLKGGQFDAGEEICRTCISIRTVMLGQDHPDTLSAQETLAKLARYRTNA